jgi:hypothetical protein
MNPALLIFVATVFLIPDAAHAAPATAADPGRLFYTPAQRAQLENARARQGSAPVSRNPESASDTGEFIPAPKVFDGIVSRSDGAATRWVDGKAQRNAAGVAGLKPGQIRANGKVYEPYQVLRPAPTTAPTTTSEDDTP